MKLPPDRPYRVPNTGDEKDELPGLRERSVLLVNGSLSPPYMTLSERPAKDLFFLSRAIWPELC
jgi:hypothetical protein